MGSTPPRRNQADAYSKEELTEIFMKYDIRAPEASPPSTRWERGRVRLNPGGEGFQVLDWEGIDRDLGNALVLVLPPPASGLVNSSYRRKADKAISFKQCR